MPSVRILLASSLAIALALPMGDAHAAPVAPTGDAFKIWYYKTDEDGDRKQYFSSQDLSGYINRARCECAQDISTRILLSPASGGTYNNTLAVRTYVGSRCDQAISGAGQLQFKPCVKAYDGYANAYTKGINFSFAPIWLAGGIDRDAPGTTLDDAVPFASCTGNQGDAGIWICIENGQSPDCQADEFQVTGTQNNNATGSSSSTGGTMPTGGIHYDFQPPTNLPDPEDFSIDTGDGTVLITWKLLTTGDVNGYRVLCADEDGNPLPGKGLDPPPLSQINIGKLYFTKDNLCPNGPFGDDVPQDDTGGTESGGSESGGSESGGSDSGTGTGTSGGVVDIDDDIIDGLLHASSDSSGSATATATATDGGSSSDTGSAPPVDIPEDGIMSMKWEYVCSGHIGGTSHEAKITGLENGKTYQFAIVAYDLAGNPVVASGETPLTASPRETLDFWEQCEIDGNVCGEGGFCNCSVEDDGRSDALWLGALAGFAALRRRRRGRR